MKKGLIVLFGLVLIGAAGFATGTEEPAGAGMDKITYSCYYYYQAPESQAAFEAYFYDTTGVELEVLSVPKDNWEDKIRAMMISGDAADVTQAPNDMTPLVNQGFLVALDDYVAADPGFAVLKDDYPQIFRSGTVDGSVYGIASGGGSFMNLWIRQDWLDELGLAMPDNMADLVDTLDAFKGHQFKLGTGDIPLVMTNSIWNHDVFATYWGAFNEVVAFDGVYRDWQLTPEFKEYLDFMRDLYARGILDREMPTNGYGDARNKGGLGNTGAVVMWDDTYDSFADRFITNGIEGALMVPVPPFRGPDGVFGLSYSPEGTHFAITNEAADPEFVFEKFMHWFFLEEPGIIATSRGTPGFDFDVVDGVLVPLDNPGANVGHHGQKFPPVILDFEYPFKLDPISQGEYDNIITVREWAKPFFSDVEKVYPPKGDSAYWTLEGDIYDTKRALNSRYIVGEINYQEFVDEYTKYVEEIGLQDIIDNMNNM